MPWIAGLDAGDPEAALDHYDAAFFGVDLPEGVPANQRESVYPSPTWCTPRDRP
jgi:hypothetical protein